MTEVSRTTSRRPSPWSRFAAAVCRCAAVGVVATAATVASGQVLAKEKPEAIQGVDAVERLGDRIPLRLEFRDSEGETVPLASQFDGDKPVILMMGYFSCPVVCPTILNQMTASFNELDYTIGEDFRVVVVSIDPRETPTHALAEKTEQLSAYNRGGEPGVSDGWTFLVGEEAEARSLADAVGYVYKKLPNGEYSHPVVLTVLSPTGQITRYIYGFEYPADQIKLSLLDASEGTIAKSLGDRILHYCFRYDPLAGKYSPHAMAVMRIAGILTVVGLTIFIGVLFAGEKVRKKLRARSGAGPSAAPMGQVTA